MKISRHIPSVYLDTAFLSSYFCCYCFCLPELGTDEDKLSEFDLHLSDNACISLSAEESLVIVPETGCRSDVTGRDSTQKCSYSKHFHNNFVVKLETIPEEVDEASSSVTSRSQITCDAESASPLAKKVKLEAISTPLRVEQKEARSPMTLRSSRVDNNEAVCSLSQDTQSLWSGDCVVSRAARLPNTGRYSIDGTLIGRPRPQQFMFSVDWFSLKVLVLN